MRKMMKSIVCLAIAAALVLSLAACGCGYSNSPDGVVKRVLNARNNYDYVTLEKYYEDGEEYEDMAKDGVKDLKTYYDWLIDEDRYEEEEDEMGEKAFKAYINAKIEIKKAYNKRCKVEIDKVKKDGDEAEVKYTEYYPETKKGEYELMEKAAKNVDLKDEFQENKLDEKEWEKVIKEWKKLALEQIKEADLEDYDGEIFVVKDDGKWKIAEDQSGE
ncbi:MAG: hypothetical protein IJ316_05425 [Clostridia bacterium]|nr:hypothetical protein [Clostridia bacterium]